MNKFQLLVLFFCILKVCLSATPYCPVPRNGKGIFQSDSIELNLDGQYRMIKDEDTYCFNVSLKQPFVREPSVAISIRGFQFEHTDNMFFSIKPVSSFKNQPKYPTNYNKYNKQQYGRSNYSNEYNLQKNGNSVDINLAILKFIVRTQWIYTKWQKLSFMYLATDNKEVQLGYYLVDSGQLAGCQNNKKVDIFLPYKSSHPQKMAARAFLHGMQINSKTYQNTKTPLELQIIKVQTNYTGLTVSLTVTTPTVVNSIYISYFAYYDTEKLLSYVYSTDNITKITQRYSPIKPYGYQMVQFHGLSGFIIKNYGTQKNSFLATWTGEQFYFDLGSLDTLYFSYSYMFLVGNPCSDCSDYNLIDSYQCVKYCPRNSFSNGVKCVTCQKNQIWNGTICVQNCKGGRIWSAQQNQCVCSYGLNWNGYNCFACPVGQIWNDKLTICQCPYGKNWNGFSCVQVIVCPYGQTYNISSKNCQCPYGTNWNGYQCASNYNPGGSIGITSCPPGQVYNVVTKQCLCPNGLYWNGQYCLQCPNGQQWNPQVNQCSCPYNQVWNGYSCVLTSNPSNPSICRNGSVWDSYKNICVCSNGQPFNGQSCEQKCIGGKLKYDGFCYCQQGSYWDGYQCKYCGNGQMYNGISCVPISCNPGSYWNGYRCECGTCGNTCPPGTFFSNGKCIPVPPKCPYGTNWDGSNCVSDTKQCYQGQYLNQQKCSPIPTQCPYNTQWNGYQCKIKNNECPYNTQYNGGSCVPTKICQNGQKWDNKILQCTCLEDSYWNSAVCTSCGNGRKYINGKCQCPKGLFWMNNQCRKMNSYECSITQHSIWNGQSCLCAAGFIAKDDKCVCEGFYYGSECKNCYYKSNSYYSEGICKCSAEYYEVNGQCVKKGINIGNQKKDQCSIATYFDQSQKRCLPCSDGCLSCTDCYTCTTCREQFTYDHSNYLCREICGDGKRFSLECDDGNNNDGDGCSRDCRIQYGYTCFDGSPTKPDTCTNLKPENIRFKQTGQTHVFGKIIINVQANYLPAQLLKKQCTTKCNILTANIVKGFNSTTSIKTQYVPTTSFTFAIEIEFGIEPISKFSVQVSMNKQIKERYFPNVNIQTKQIIDVNPAYLALFETGNQTVPQDILA